jgi:hypothetical protein
VFLIPTDLGGRVRPSDSEALRHGASLATRHGKDFEGCGLRLVDPWR